MTDSQTTNDPPLAAPTGSVTPAPDTERRPWIICPHCGEEMEDSSEWGYPDTDWSEEGQCPYCEEEFLWERQTRTTYTTHKLGAQKMFVVEYAFDGRDCRTVIESADVDSARVKFLRNNPDLVPTAIY